MIIRVLTLLNNLPKAIKPNATPRRRRRKAKATSFHGWFHFSNFMDEGYYIYSYIKVTHELALALGHGILISTYRIQGLQIKAMAMNNSTAALVIFCINLLLMSSFGKGENGLGASFIFGDSLVDAGNNNYLSTLSRANMSKAKIITTKFYPRQDADLPISYDVIQAYQNNYFAQVTLENNNPLGRLDHWNLTWEWMRGEFIYSMKGAYTHLKDGSSCIYGPPSQYYGDMDFSQVQNSQKKPVITDLPPDRAEDEKIGKIPFCCP